MGKDCHLLRINMPTVGARRPCSAKPSVSGCGNFQLEPGGKIFQKSKHHSLCLKNIHQPTRPTGRTGERAAVCPTSRTDSPGCRGRRALAPGADLLPGARCIHFSLLWLLFGSQIAHLHGLPPSSPFWSLLGVFCPQVLSCAP